MAKRRVLRAMQIMELSAVDNPAQEGARYLIAKRHEKNETEGYTMSADDKPACDCDKPQVEDGKCKKCGKPVGKGLTDPDPDEGNSVEISKEGDMTDAEKLAKAEQDLADEKAKNEVLAKVAGMSDSEKEHFDALKELDAEGADKFLDMDASARAVEIEKAKTADPVVYTDSEGHEYHKSEAKAAALAKRADDAVRENKELKDAAVAVTFEKRAAEYPHLKGETPVKVALLRAIDGMDEDMRKSALEMLKANDAGIADAMKTLGTKAGPAPTEPEAKLNKMAEERATADKISFAKAYDMVAQSPEGQKLYAEMIEAKQAK